MTGYFVGFKQKYERTLFAPKDKNFQSTFFVLTFSHSCIFVSISVSLMHRMLKIFTWKIFRQVGWLVLGN